MFELEIVRRGKVSLIHLRGEMQLADAVDLRSQLESVIKTSQAKDIALDLCDVVRVDSSGLGALVGASATARTLGKRLMLYKPSPEVNWQLEHSDIAGFFPLVEDEEDLLARLAQ